MSTQKNHSIYGSGIRILPAIVTGILMYGIIWSLQQLFFKHWIITNTCDWITLTNLPFCILLIAYIVYYAFKLHREPVIVMNEQGITIYKFGFIPWHEIDALSIVETPRKFFYKRTFVIQLKKTWRAQSVGWFDKLFMHAQWDASAHTIAININNLKAGPRKLIHIYEQLVPMVPHLKNIDHRGLYEHYAAIPQKTVFPIYISKARSWFLIFGLATLVFYLVTTIYAFHERLWWQLLLAIFIIVPVLLIVLAWLLRIFQRQRQTEPELIFNEQGITIHLLGLVPWNDIQKIRLEETGGRHRTLYLFLDLVHDSLWQPVQQKRFGISTFNARKKIITIDCNYLKIGRRGIIDIYESLMIVVPRLHDIDHKELY